MGAADVKVLPASATGSERGPSGTGASPILTLVAAALNHRAFVLTGVALGLTLAVLPALLSPPKYKVSASFMPQARRGASNVSGLAAQLGIDISAGDAVQSPQFYVELLRSSELLRSVVLETRTDIGNLPMAAGAGGAFDDPAGFQPEAERALEKAIHGLRDKLEATASPKTGIVTFTISDTSPTLAAGLARSILTQLNRFNLESRQSQARSERIFTEQRLAAATAELRRAEHALQQFQEDNRGFKNSPRLALQQEGLAREIGTRQQVHALLTSSYEQSRIEEVRDTPVLTVIERPRVPANPKSRGLVARFLVGVIAGALLGLVLALGKQAWDSMRGGGATPWDGLQSMLRRHKKGVTA